MENLFQGSTLFIFFFAMIAIFNYTALKLEQRIAIIYITVYALNMTGIIEFKWSVIYLFLTMFCFLEILTDDSMKLKILSNPFYKIIDCVYLSFSQYGLLFILISLFFLYEKVIIWADTYSIIFKILSFVVFSLGIMSILHQKFSVNSIKTIYRTFSQHPINDVDFNEKLNEACLILTSIEDKEYFIRKSHSIFSPLFLIKKIFRRLKCLSFKQKINECKYFVSNILTFNRGYSTIQMQLIRSLGIKSGYNCKFRRKIYEIIYSKMFFDGIEHLMKYDKVAKRKNFKKYILYIYFHSAKTFLGDATFSKFLNAFDMQYNKKNIIDIYDCSNEGIFIACMGLNKRATKINNENIDYYLNQIPVELDRQEILAMISTMMDKPYNGNYLK